MPQMIVSGRMVPAGNTKSTTTACPFKHMVPSNHCPALAPVQLTRSADGRNGIANVLVSVAITEPTVGAAGVPATLYSVIVNGRSNVAPGVVTQVGPVPVSHA